MPTTTPRSCCGDRYRRQRRLMGPGGSRCQHSSDKKGWCQTGRWRGGSVSNTSCRQGPGGPGKEEQLSGEPRLAFTLHFNSTAHILCQGSPLSSNVLSSSTADHCAGSGKMRRHSTGAAKQRLMTSICFRVFKHRMTPITSAFAQVCKAFLLLLLFSPENHAGQFQAYILLEFT